MRRAPLILLTAAMLLLSAAFVSACRANRTPFPTCTDNGADIEFAETPTWSGDVAAVVYEHCVGCHRAGGVAPFSFESYAEAADKAGEMARAVVDRLMPPPGPTNCGECRTFHDSRRLEPEEIAAIRAWADGGAPEGDPAQAPELPGPPGGLDRVDMTLQAEEPYMPVGDGNDDYRCFIVTPELSETRYLTGFSVNPENADIVHHVILYGMYSEEQRALAVELDASDPEPGFQCFGGSGIDDAPMLAVWAPGSPPIAYPEGTGIRLTAGMELVMQVHYNLGAGAVPDQSSIDLRLDDSVTDEAVIVDMAHGEFALEPGLEEVISEHVHQDFIGPFGEVQVHAVAPHMHTMGRSLSVEIYGGSRYECMVDVPVWDFEWQGLFFYEEPVEVGSGDKIRITCTWDTRAASDTVTWGDGTDDEMCLALFYVTGLPQWLLDENYAAQTE